MNDRQIKLIIGSLLHDIGKVVYRSGDGRNHSQSGYEYLKVISSDFDSEILNCVRYHHGAMLKNAKIQEDDLSYITYYADNVAAAMDRREGMDAEDGFDKTVPLFSVFNILNGNHGHQHYAHQVLNPNGEINYPTENPVTMDSGFYRKVIDQITDNLNGIEISEEYINSLLSVLEANLLYIPSSTSRREQADISLYDHVKMTAAVAECIYQYMEQNEIDDYKAFLFQDSGKQAWDKKMFLLYSMDMSGIQKFIYTISSKGALKGLRARSFYLEILMEHIIDETLSALTLSRSSLIYSGGGHCYMLLPNTDRVKEILKKQQEQINHWFIDKFDTALYLACGYAECSASNLKNEPEGSYSELFLKVSRMIATQKGHRYSANEIRALNANDREGERECVICRRVGQLNKDDKCPICAALEQMSKAILYEDYFVILLESFPGALPLPNGKYLVAGDKKELLGWMKKDTYVRSYTKNEMYTGKHVTTKIWVGNYTTGDTFEDLAEKAEGIERIAVLRGDVDNLGNSFVNGFKREKEGNRYETLSRTAAFSRQLSLFFKCYLNKILKDGKSAWVSQGGERQLSIVYSGGDDIFLVGAWNEVIDAFMDIRDAFQRFTDGTLTISGGIEIYTPSYPINRMAFETEALEELSKTGDKNAVTLFDESGRYSWPEFLDHVMDKKYQTIQKYFSITHNRGKAFLYHLLELLREDQERFNRARFVYFLSRMEPTDQDGGEEQEAYKEFSAKMYMWSTNKEERRQLVTAIYLYVYFTREKEREEVHVDQ